MHKISSQNWRLATAAAAVALTLAAAGCAQPEKSAGAQGANAAPNAQAGVQHAKQQVDKYSAVIDGFLPSQPINGTASLAGKTVMYIPAVAAVPYFATGFTAITAALETVDVKVQQCDAQANPSLLASCFNQALTQDMAGVVVDSITPALAEEAFKEVAASGIPVALVNVPLPEGSPKNVVSMGPDSAKGHALAADAVIASSNGAANVLGLHVIDSDATKSWWQEGAVAEFEKYCPDCKLVTVETKTADLQNAPSKVSAALLANPAVDHLFAQLSPEVTPITKGAMDAGKPSLPTVSVATALADLQQIKAKSGLSWSVGWDQARAGWLSADLLMRMLTSTPVTATDYVLEPRIFSADNVAELDVSQAGWNSSDWFGGPAYQEDLKALWK